MTARPSRRTRIKICGITAPEIAEVAVEGGADFIGLVFARGSPRRITDFRVATEIISVLPAGVEPVGVFAHPLHEASADLEQWKSCGHWCQLHGELDEESLRDLAQSHRVIRGFHFTEEQTLRWNACADVTALLIDGPRAGSGQSFDQARLAAMMDRINKPVFLAGGLDPQNVGAAIRAVRPYAVDVSTGVESSPGVKDPNLIRAFCRAARAAVG
ncbi:MAG: phosphoribosylanthranilate isomerase [Phycisphaerales bacterium]|nr:MAG: phosphoribosylanthranilate isomerase [Phycisphaerales bacterium]